MVFLSAREAAVHEAWTRRIGKKVRRMVRTALHRKYDGVSWTLLDEHNARDEQERFEAVATEVARRLAQCGLYAEVQAYETSQMGGQHMEWVNHVILTVLRHRPHDRVERDNLRIRRR